MGLALAASATFLALRQPPRADPFQPVSPGSADWWLYPVERNAFKRLPTILDDLHDAFVLPGTQKIWVVGAAGLIAHSADSGRTWNRQEVDWPSRFGSAEKAARLALRTQQIIAHESGLANTIDPLAGSY